MPRDETFSLQVFKDREKIDEAKRKLVFEENPFQSSGVSVVKGGGGNIATT